MLTLAMGFVVMIVAAVRSDSPGENLVRARLNDPDSAQFRNVRESSRDTEVWCGEVNAKNRMGAMVGFTRFVANARVGSANLDVDSPISTEQEAQQRLFRSAWDTYCGWSASTAGGAAPSYNTPVDPPIPTQRQSAKEVAERAVRNHVDATTPKALAEAAAARAEVERRQEEMTRKALGLPRVPVRSNSTDKHSGKATLEAADASGRAAEESAAEATRR